MTSGYEIGEKRIARWSGFIRHDGNASG
jgi:hypothetical protein